MKIHLVKKISYSFVFVLFTSITFGQIGKNGTFLGLHFGSMGAGLQLGTSINDKLSARITGSYLQLSMVSEDKGIKLFTQKNRKLTTGGVGLVSDWKIMKKSDFLKVSVGVFYQMNNILETRYYNYIEDGANEDLGSLTIDIYTFPVSPYLGILLGKTNPDKKFNFKIEIGSLFHGKPKLDFTGTGRIEPTSEQDDVVLNNLKNYNFYPNMNIQFNFKIK